MKVQQCTLQSGSTVTTGWLEAGRVAVGNEVTLKGDESPIARRWTVIAVHGAVVEQSDINRGFHAGGL